MVALRVQTLEICRGLIVFHSGKVSYKVDIEANIYLGFLKFHNLLSLLQLFESSQFLKEVNFNTFNAVSIDFRLGTSFNSYVTYYLKERYSRDIESSI